MKKFNIFFLLIIFLSAYLFAGCSYTNTPNVLHSTAESLITPVTTQTQDLTSVIPSNQTTTIQPMSTFMSTPKTTLAPTLKHTATPSPTPAGVTEERYGYLTKAYSKNGVKYIEINYVDLYWGADKLKMAIKDHWSELEKDENGNYYFPYDGPYIRDTSKKLRTFPVDAKCKIQLVEDDPSSYFLSVSWQTFCLAEKKIDWRLLMIINVQNGVIKSMEEEQTWE